MNKLLPVFALVLAVSACGQQTADKDTSAAESAGPASKDSAQGAASSESAQGAASNESGQGAALKLNNDDQKRSYALGMDIGNSVKDLPVDLQVDYLAAGIRDVVQGNETQLSEEQQKAVMKSFVEELKSAQQEKASAQAEKNQQAGKQFLAKNKSKDGVEVTDSGLQYKVVKAGEGEPPSAKDSVKVNYEGRLIDGTVFDSSYERGEPVTFPVSAVIPGWTEALQLMKPGSEYMLYIPSDLAYGERGAGDKIGPDQTLIFKVEMLEVIPAEEGDAEE